MVKILNTYRNAIERYWQNFLTQEQRDLVLKKFEFDYPVSAYLEKDSHAKYIILDEFQAYLLEFPNKGSLIPESIRYHRELLINFIFKQTR